jgi:ABC-type glycerol-3-phosphate transport system substrate-binding protein
MTSAGKDFDADGRRGAQRRHVAGRRCDQPEATAREGRAGSGCGRRTGRRYAQDAHREIDRRTGDHAQAHELVPVRAGPSRGLEHHDGQVQQEPINSIVKKVGVHPSSSHNYIRKGGNLYGISIVEVAFGLLYNKALLAKAGFTKPATTPEEWLTQTVKLTTKPNQFGLYSPNTMAESFSFWFTLQDWANAYDAKWAIGKKPNLTDPKIIKTLTVWKEFYDQTVPQGSNDAASARLFSNGQIAQELIVSAAVNIIKTTGPKIFPDLRSVPAPWASGKQISRLHPLSIVKNTKNMDGAVAFVTFMTEPDNMAQLMRGSLDVVPAFPEVLQVKGMKAWLDSQKWSTGYRAIKPVSQLDVEGDFVYHDTEFGQIILTNFQRALTGSTSIDSAMADAQKQAQALADRVL